MSIDAGAQLRAMPMTDLPVLEKRRVQAEAIGPIFAEMEARLGREQAEAILDAAIRKAAIAEGAGFRDRITGETGTMAAFVDLFELWTRGGALEVEVLEASDAVFDFNVTRCRYAEMYREMGLGDIGHLLSCNRDGTFAQGFDPDLELEREQTIMKGAPCCTFRYRLKADE
jgi:hypothetical protein